MANAVETIVDCLATGSTGPVPRLYRGRDCFGRRSRARFLDPTADKLESSGMIGLSPRPNRTPHSQDKEP